MKHIDFVAKCLALLAIGIGLCIITGFLRLADNPFLGFAFAGALLMHLWTRPKLRECLVVALCGLVLSGVYRFLDYPSGDFYGYRVINASAFLGQGSMLVLLARALWCEDEQRQQSILRVLLPGAALVGFMMVTGVCLTLAYTVNHNTYDIFLYKFDDSLGFQASFAIGRLFADCRPLWCLGFLVYEALPLAVSFLYAAQLNSRTRPEANTLILFMTVGMVGFALYQIYPAAGPIYAFRPVFPWRAPAASQLSSQTMRLAAPANAMPSLHATWALLLWWNSKHLRWWVQVLTGSFTLITLLATLGSGEHYLIDLVVAVPFSLAMQAACSGSRPWKAPERFYPLAAGSAMVAMWMVLLRFGVSYFQQWHLLSWALVVSTVAVSAVMARPFQEHVLEAPAPVPESEVGEVGLRVRSAQAGASE